MKTLARAAFLVMTVMLAAISACAEEDPTAMTKQTDVAALGRLIRLGAATPEAAEWQTRQLGEGSDWELVAVLTYSDAVYETALSEAPEKPELDDAVGFRPFDWTATPEGVVPGDSGMNVVRTGVRSAAAFASAPLNDGFAVAIPERRQILVYLHTS